MTTLLYHYSKDLYPELKTRRAQGVKINKVEDNEERSYYDHISLFLEPIPLDILPAIHKNQHPFYKDGDVVYEYSIPLAYLKNWFYTLVESPEKCELYYDDRVSEEDYVTLMKKIVQENNYEDTDLKQLEKIVKRFRGTTRTYFKQLPSLPNYESIKNKYAPCVPHLMIYSSKGILSYSQVVKRQFGSDIKVSFKNW
jgi:hypothetical protein